MSKTLAPLTTKSQLDRPDPWRIVIFDTETCPLVRPVVMKSGRSVPNVNNATIIQYAFADINGDLIVPNTNLNPELQNWSDIVGYTEYVENAWGIDAGQLAAEAARLPTFAQSILASIYTLRTQVSKRLIIAAHNGNGWDFPIFRRQMRECGYLFPNDMEIITLDTQYITKECLQRLNPHDRKWSLGYAHQKLFGKDILDQHTAAGDVKALARILRHWATPYCPAEMTEAHIVGAILNRTTRGLSRSELLGVTPATPGTGGMTGPKAVRLLPRLPVIEEKKKEVITHEITPGEPVDAERVIASTPAETAQRLQQLPAPVRRSLLASFDSAASV
jgi:hypothetical protein